MRQNRDVTMTLMTKCVGDVVLCFLRMRIPNYATDCREIFKDCFMHSCPALRNKANIIVCEIES